MSNMTTDALNALFALLETEDDNFESLMKRFGIDPATDLQNCDLNGVDFGELSVDILDLTGSDLEGANLSKVKCRKLIGADGVATERKQNRVLGDVLLAISRYQNSDWVLNQIVGALSESSAPVLAFYDSAAEQDLLTKRICAHYTDASHLREGFNMHASGMKVLWFYTKSSKGQFKLNPAVLDRAFFEALRESNKSDDIGIYPLRPNQSAIQRIRNSVRPGAYDAMREDFALSLRKELSNKEFMSGHGSVLIFSGFPPISKRLHRAIRDAVNGRITFIFLCSSSLQPQYLQGGGLPWRRVAVPAYSIGEPLAVKADIRRLIRRIGIASGGKITFDSSFEGWMNEFAGKPLAALKRELATELKNALVQAALTNQTLSAPSH
jgi:hypothetical protein